MDLSLLQAQNLSDYISLKYGSEVLGKFRILTSLHRFRTLPHKTMTGGLSLEGYLRENYGIWWKRARGDGNFSFTVHSKGKSIGVCDDELGSVGGAIINAHREVYKEAKRLFWQPMVQAGYGIKVNDIVDHFNFDAFYTEVVEPASTGALSAYAGNLVRDRVDDTATPIERYNFVESLYDFYVALRQHDPLTLPFTARGDEAPLANEVEAMGVITGTVKKSLRLTKPNKKLLELANEAHNNSGDINEEGTQITFYKAYNPFRFIKSDFIKLPEVVRQDLVDVPSEPPQQTTSTSIGAIDVEALQARMQNATVTQFISQQIADDVDSTDPDVVERVTAHLAKHLTEDPNQFDAAKAAHVYFGSCELKATIEQSFSKLPSKWFTQLRRGVTITFEDLVRDGLSFFGGRLLDYDERQLCLLIAGQLLKRKGQIVVRLNGPNKGVMLK